MVSDKEKKELIEKLKKEYDRGGAGLGGLKRSMGLGTKDSDFEKLAEEILRSKKPQPTPPKVGDPTQIQFSTPPKYVSPESLFPELQQEKKLTESEAARDQFEEEVREVGRLREGAIRYRDELKDYKEAVKWFKEALQSARACRKKATSKGFTIGHNTPWLVSKKRELELMLMDLLTDFGDTYVNMGKFGNAKKYYKKILEEMLEWGSEPIIEFNGWKKWQKKQRKRLREKWIKESSQDLMNWTSQWGRVLSYDQYVLNFMSIGEYKEAVKLYKEATRLAPTSAIYWARLGAAHMEKGEAKKAEAAFERAETLVFSDTTFDAPVLQEMVRDIIKSAYTSKETT